MLVNQSNFEYLKSVLAKDSYIAVDTETTGLRPFHGDYPFAVVIGVDTESFYVPVRVSAGITQGDLIDLSSIMPLFAGKTVFMHNAKFDLHHMATIGLCFPPEASVHCTMVAARLLNSDLPSYSLDACARYFLKGEAKDDKVMDYIREHDECQSYYVSQNSGKSKKLLHFDKVPLDLIVPYALKDAELTYRLGMHQLHEIERHDKFLPEGKKKLSGVLSLEYRTTRALEAMERAGVRIDYDRTMCAIVEAETEISEAARKYAQETGDDYKASTKAIYGHLKQSGYDTSDIGRTDKGNVCLDKSALGKITSPIAEYVLCAKNAKARLNFYLGFIDSADTQRVIHTDFHQSGAKTGRFSSSNPNLQNLKRPDESEGFGPRHCIVPPSPDYCFLFIDYNQMEYRLMLDYAGEMDIIEQVKAGLDVHQATADRVKVSRDFAKTLNFALIYGAGVGYIAEALGMSEMDAKDTVAQYFAAMPKVKDFIHLVRHIAKKRGYTVNWAGRLNHYTGYQPKIHASVNHLIQGGSSDVMRVGLVGCFDYMKCMKSYTVLSVHDELIFALHRDELHLATGLQDIMDNAYPYRYLQLTTSVSHSFKSMGEKVKGFPTL